MGLNSTIETAHPPMVTKKSCCRLQLWRVTFRLMETYVEKRRRGIIGWFFLVVFILWNALMLFWFYQIASIVGTDWPGLGLSWVFMLFVWAIGSVITGILAMIFGGRKTVTRRIS